MRDDLDIEQVQRELLAVPGVVRAVVSEAPDDRAPLEVQIFISPGTSTARVRQAVRSRLVEMKANGASLIFVFELAEAPPSAIAPPPPKPGVLAPIPRPVRKYAPAPAAASQGLPLAKAQMADASSAKPPALARLVGSAAAFLLLVTAPWLVLGRMADETLRGSTPPRLVTPAGDSGPSGGAPPIVALGPAEQGRAPIEADDATQVAGVQFQQSDAATGASSSTAPGAGRPIAGPAPSQPGEEQPPPPQPKPGSDSGEPDSGKSDDEHKDKVAAVFRRGHNADDDDDDDDGDDTTDTSSSTGSTNKSSWSSASSWSRST